ncbi:MAG: UvrD-helicase domain-containing protein [Deltaproteobacteria bacterium]|nr:UvrD-helicase domain-containing protein [Deltaproteobacteria bacterium]
MDLNERQKEAVEALEGPLLIIAGAGSGKTRVLTYRIANLISHRKTQADEILAVTFTNKAAREMKERVEKILKRDVRSLWISTFHSSCVRILRQEIERLGYTSQFIIYDGQDQLTVIKNCLKELKWDEKMLSPRAAQSRIGHAKNLGLTPKNLLKKAISSYDEKLCALYELYQKTLIKADAVDFDDLLFLTVDLFQKFPVVLEKYQKKFHYCLVDEYQDTNHMQYLLVKSLVEQHKNICVVGDEDQSIYSWRGADISNILSFEKDFPQAKVIKLEENYRSTKNIIEAASHVIAKNKSRKSKNLWTQNGEGPLLQALCLQDEYHEARCVVGEISKHFEAGEPLRNFAIFYRTNAQSRVFEEILRQYNLPYQIYGGTHFYGRSEIKDILAYFRLVLNSKDDVSFLRIVNTPARGIGKTTLERLQAFAQIQNLPLYEACKQFSLVDELMEKLKKQESNVQDLYRQVLDATRYIQILKEEGTIEAQSRVENLEELDSALGEYVRRNPKATLDRYLEEISLVSDLDALDEGQDFVKLMTLHSAKGLEFSTVFMVGLEEGLFPHALRDEAFEDIEEERRLCYVGMTRAKENLYLTYAASRRVHGQPQYNLSSRFLNEIPSQYVSILDLRQRTRRHSERSEESPLLQDDIYADDFNQDVAEALFSPGMRLRHPSFGVGVVCRIEGQEENTKLTIKFDNGAIKKFLAAQTPLERLT